MILSLYNRIVSFYASFNNKQVLLDEALPSSDSLGYNKISKNDIIPSQNSLKKTFPCGSFFLPVQTKKRKNWDNFLGANLKVCHPKGLFLNLGRPWTSPKGPFGTECGSH
jgi:hypothetical protein